MKKLALLMLMLLLTIAEVYLFSAFLPPAYQRAINDHISNILPSSNDWTPITHPLLSQEIDQVLHDNVGLRVALYALTAALLIGNALLIRVVWRLFRGAAGTGKSSR